MPGTYNSYGQMFDHELNPRKGWSGDRSLALEKTLPVAAVGTRGSNRAIYAGCALEVYGNTFYFAGEHTEDHDTLFPPLFAFQNENDFDVNPDLGNIGGGVIMALSCLGSFELETTEVSGSSGYLCGKPLAAADHSSDTLAGKLKVGVLGVDTICGIVSEQYDGSGTPFTNEHGKSVVRFWTWYCPKIVDTE